MNRSWVFGRKQFIALALSIVVVALAQCHLASRVEKLESTCGKTEVAR